MQYPLKVERCKKDHHVLGHKVQQSADTGKSESYVAKKAQVEHRLPHLTLCLKETNASQNCNQ